MVSLNVPPPPPPPINNQNQLSVTKPFCRCCLMSIKSLFCIFVSFYFSRINKYKIFEMQVYVAKCLPTSPNNI